MGFSLIILTILIVLFQWRGKWAYEGKGWGECSEIIGGNVKVGEGLGESLEEGGGGSGVLADTLESGGGIEVDASCS